MGFNIGDLAITLANAQEHQRKRKTEDIQNALVQAQANSYGALERQRELDAYHKGEELKDKRALAIEMDKRHYQGGVDKESERSYHAHQAELLRKHQMAIAGMKVEPDEEEKYKAEKINELRKLEAEYRLLNDQNDPVQPSQGVKDPVTKNVRNIHGGPTRRQQLERRMSELSSFLFGGGGDKSRRSSGGGPWPWSGGGGSGDDRTTEYSASPQFSDSNRLSYDAMRGGMPPENVPGFVIRQQEAMETVEKARAAKTLQAMEDTLRPAFDKNMNKNPTGETFFQMHEYFVNEAPEKSELISAALNALLDERKAGNKGRLLESEQEARGALSYGGNPLISAILDLVSRLKDTQSAINNNTDRSVMNELSRRVSGGAR